MSVIPPGPADWNATPGRWSCPVFITTVAFARQTGDALAARGLGEAETGACTTCRPAPGHALP